MSAITRMRVSISYATQSGIQSKETFDTASAANAHLDALRELARIAAVDGRGDAAAAAVEEARRAVAKDRVADGAIASEEVPSDREMLDWLERNATSGFRFNFELATLTFRVPEQFEGSNSFRELIRSAMADETGDDKTE